MFLVNVVHAVWGRWVEDLCKMVAALFTAITLSMLDVIIHATPNLHAPTLSNDCCFCRWRRRCFATFTVTSSLIILPLLLRCLFRQSHPISFTKGHQQNGPKSDQRKLIKNETKVLFHLKVFKMRQIKGFQLLHRCFNLSEICLALVGSKGPLD